MTYRETLERFSEQCQYEPTVINKEKLRQYWKIIALGMGGSRLAPDLFNMLYPELEIRVHSDFGLPPFSEQSLGGSLIIGNSHSGETAEVLEGVDQAFEKGLNLGVVMTGGTLATRANERGLPHVVTPAVPAARLGIGYDMTALMALAGLDRQELKAYVASETLSEQGKTLAETIGDSIPLFYTSNQFKELGYIWKVIFNETAKIPAFCNRLPEAGHNEIVGFDDSSHELSRQLKCVMIQDPADERTTREMKAITDILSKKGVMTVDVELTGTSMIEKALSSLLLAHWTALALAEQKGVDPLTTPAIDELKKQAA